MHFIRQMARNLQAVVPLFSLSVCKEEEKEKMESGAGGGSVLFESMLELIGAEININGGRVYESQIWASSRG